jgi:hypothetical protein
MDPKNNAPAPTSMAPMPPGVAVNVPLLYADLMLDVRPGASTSKILLAVNHGSINAPTIQIVMPTGELLEAARRIVAALTAPDAAKDAKAQAPSRERSFEASPR